jgi:DNA-binding LacI/PurR family transcriptional regulator
VIGFDDVPEAADYLPPLTTVRQDFPALAEAVVAALTTDVDAVLPPDSTIVPTRLIARASTRGHGPSRSQNLSF